MVDSPILSYIDVWHANFLPPRFIVGEARELGQRYTCSNELAPPRDKLAERVSRCLHELAHTPVEPEAPIQEAPIQPEIPAEPEAPIQETEQVAVEFVNSETESDRDEDMVTRKTMTIDHFMPGSKQTTQQQPSQSRGQTPPAPPSPSPPSNRSQKRQLTAEQTLAGQRDAQARTPPPPLNHQEVPSSKNHRFRSERTWCPPPKQHQRGNLHSNWTTNLFPRVLAYECGRKVKGVVLPKAWCTTSFYPRTCMTLRRGRKNPWEEGCSGILSQ